VSDIGVRITAFIAISGAIVQLAYGILAIAFPWPEIVSPGGEGLWIAANAGMLAGYVGWALVVARSRTVTVGVVVAGIGFTLRIVAAIVTIVSPAADVLPLVLGSIALTLLGVVVVSVGTVGVIGGRRWEAWVPTIAVLVELGLASMYTVDTPLHFVLLGLLWGVVSLVIALVVARHGSVPSRTRVRAPGLPAG